MLGALPAWQHLTGGTQLWLPPQDLHLFHALNSSKATFTTPCSTALCVVHFGSLPSDVRNDSTVGNCPWPSTYTLLLAGSRLSGALSAPRRPDSKGADQEMNHGKWK